MQLASPYASPPGGNLTVLTPYSASKPGGRWLLVRREFLSPLTKNPQEGKEAGWKAHHSTVPFRPEGGTGWDDSQCA